MLTWTVYYEEYQRRQNLLDEARQYRLILDFSNIKRNRTGKNPFRIQFRRDSNAKQISSKYK